MRRLFLVGVLSLIPWSVLADLHAGGTLLYDPRPAADGTEAFRIQDLRPAAEARLKLWFIELGLCAVPYVDKAELLVLSDVGVAFDASFLRVGVAWGLYQWLSLVEAYPPALEGLNAKLSAQLRLGVVSVGLEAWWFFANRTPQPTLAEVFGRPPLLGVAVFLGTPP